MKGKGPQSERETIINFNEEEDTASIWTASDAVYRRRMLSTICRRADRFDDDQKHAKSIAPFGPGAGRWNHPLGVDCGRFAAHRERAALEGIERVRLCR